MTIIMDDDDFLAHYGILRRSGRYPWGSGDNPRQRAVMFQDKIAEMKAAGMKETDIVRALSTPEHPFTIRNLRETGTIARNAKKAADLAFVKSLSDKGVSNVEIGKRFDPPINESSVRSLIKQANAAKEDMLTGTANMLREEVDSGAYIDIGKGVATTRGISNEKLASAVAILKDEGYVERKVQVPQAGTQNKTTVKVLCPPGTTYADVKANMGNIRQIQQKTEDGGRTFFGMLPPKSLDSSRVAVVYKEDGGADADGVMYVRRGKEDLSLGASGYAQVRVLVDGTHYLKGMAIYKDDMPPGVDILFNTNKSKNDPKIIEGGKKAAFKEIADDPDNPFGAMVSQIGKRDEAGRLVELTSVMNVVNTEGDWDGWRKSISSQVLSKQSSKLAKMQLDEAYATRKKELDEILALTNPAVKKKLLEAYSESADAAAVHLKAAALPRQRSQVILPLKTLKDTEVFAPNYNDGELVALVRYPHGGTFEIPELTVNNRNREGRSTIGAQAKDAIGINSKVAERLSGADFDGDTVLVIPQTPGRSLKTTPALKDLEGFDAKAEYPAYEGMPRMTPKAKGQQMGMVSNLITDMTIQGATPEKIARAVKHSMVVIDAEKHHLNYKLSAQRNGIAALQKEYQPRDDGRSGGASTLISRASSEKRVRARSPRPMAKGGPIDPATGRKVYEDKPGWLDPVTGQMKYATQRSTKLRETDDAHTLVSKDGGTPIEKIYADHSNRMKALANEARKAQVRTGNIQMSRSAKEIYSNEVVTLNAKLNEALRNSPRERQAQLYAHQVVSSKRAANPNMDGSQIKRANAQALAEGRTRLGAKKALVEITDREWEAIQAGAISNHKLKQILDNTDIEKVKALATPRPARLMSGAALSKAKTMAAAGKTQAEIAAALGISLTTVKEGLNSG